MTANGPNAVTPQWWSLAAYMYRTVYLSVQWALNSMDDQRAKSGTLQRAVRLVALLNLSYFGVEFAVARAIGSVSLFADSIDFLEDATVNGMILIALGWRPIDGQLSA